MKKIDEDTRDWLLRRQRRIGLLRLHDAAKAKRYFQRTGRQRTRRLPVHLVSMPTEMLSEIEGARAQILLKVNEAIDRLEAGQRVKLDFTRTGKVFPSGLLVLLAYIELLQDLYPTKLTATAPPGSLVAQLLHHFGFAQRLSLNASTSKPTHQSVVKWRYLTGDDADGPKITELLRGYQKLGDADIPEGLYDVLVEALTNVRHWAYPAESELPPPFQKWWLFTNYQIPTATQEGRLYLAVYDMGVGIQDSLRKKLKADEIVLDVADPLLRLLKLGDNLDIETMLLKRGVEELRSTTGQSNRGKGLPEMREFVLGTDSGRMYIISGRAQYSCLAKDQKGEVFSCATKFPGTLISWSIPLGMKLKEHTS